MNSELLKSLEVPGKLELTVDGTVLRLKGTRINWEHVVQRYLDGMPLEEIATSGFVSQIPFDMVVCAINQYLSRISDYQVYIRNNDSIAYRRRAVYIQSLPEDSRSRQKEIDARLKAKKDEQDSQRAFHRQNGLFESPEVLAQTSSDQ